MLNKILENAVENAGEVIPKTSDYIGEDGLLHCGVCHTRKQSRVEIPELNISKTPPCHCECEKERRDAEEKARRWESIINAYRDSCFSNSDRRFREWTFAKDDGKNEKIKNALLRYVEEFDEMYSQGRGLLLYGSVGTGKTFYAACVANALMDNMRTAKMTNFANIRNELQNTWEGRDKYLDNLNSYDLLIIDDLASESKSEYMQEIVYNVIDSRYRAGLPLIVTTNISSEELKNPADISNERTFSRLFEMCFPIKFEGTDKRRDKLKAFHKPMSDLLGL